MRAVPCGEWPRRWLRYGPRWPGRRVGVRVSGATSTRSGEGRGTARAEMDSAGRMKKLKRDQRVRLCRRAIEIPTWRGRSAKVRWCSVREREAARRRVAVLAAAAARVPGRGARFRSSFRDWAAEETDHPREVIEAALAHVVQNKVEAAYARSDLFERRRRLMDDLVLLPVGREAGRAATPLTVRVEPRARPNRILAYRRKVAFGVTSACNNPPTIDLQAALHSALHGPSRASP